MRAIAIAMLLLLPACSCEEVCMRWEEGSPTGEKCVDWTTTMVPTLHCSPKGTCTTTMHPQVHCFKHAPCRKCLRWVDKNDAPPEGLPGLPPDRCE